MLVVTRFRIEDDAAPAFEADAKALLDLLAARPGFLGARLGRSADDPSLWVMTTEWDSAGSWRRSLSGNEMKIAAIPLLGSAIDEASVFEPLYSVAADGSTIVGASLRADARRGDPEEPTSGSR